MNVLVDTPVWSIALRRPAKRLNAPQEQVLRTLAELVSGNRTELLGPVRQELLSGIREVSQFERVRAALRAHEDVPLTEEDYEEAARMSNLCRAKGVTGSPLDYLICATATRREWGIYTLDRDFELYARHLSIKLVKA